MRNGGGLAHRLGAVSGCCEPGDLDDIFGTARAERDAREYRRRGVRGQSRWIVDALRDRARGRSVLEVGGGVGAVQIELLRAGATRATNVELSASYEVAARDLLDSTGVADRVDRHIADFVTTAAQMPPADLVVLDRVVCCYPDAQALVTAAAQHARDSLALTFPVDRWWAPIIAAAINIWPRVTGSRFRFFVHPTGDVTRAATTSGMRLESQRRGFIWQLLVFARERSDYQR